MNYNDHAQAPFSVLYAVYTTNADLELVKVVFQGYDRDMAETRMFHLFRSSAYETDFMLLGQILKTGKVEMTSYCFTEKTKHLRGECQG